MEQIVTYLESVKIARKQIHQNLTVFPLLGPDEIVPNYLTLEQALLETSVQITEISQEGNVPELKRVLQFL